jgi:hypothetical protein
MSARLKGQPKPALRGRKRPAVAKKIAAAWTPEMREAARQRGLRAAENRDWLLKIAESVSGALNPNFQDKNNAQPYAPGWGRGYRERIRARAAGTCERCGGRPDYPLDLHHKDFQKTNHAPNNLAVLCRSCHKLLHAANSRKT